MPPSNMSVFQRGGNYLHRRLTKLYSDTKQSYETATAASKTTADEDPILKALHREFRIQKDRLLAWGLQWSDSNAAPSPDVEIDQKLDQAGLGHVVASVMSKIQNLLIESEMIQNPQPSFQDKISGDSKAASEMNSLTSDDIAKSKSLLSQLITCIDSLYKLSESRRTLSSGSQTDKASRESLGKDSPGSTRNPGSQADDLHSFARTASDEGHVEEFIRTDNLFIDSSCIIHAVDATLESEKPPPYEEVMPLEKTRLLGELDVSKLRDEQRSNLGPIHGDIVLVVVDYLPTNHHRDDGLNDQYCNTLRYARQIFEQQLSSSVVSHTGSLRLVGYTIDVNNARHGLVYELPIEAQIHGDNFETPIVSNLRAVIPSKRDDSDPPSPNLEDRFRLGFNILLGMLHVCVQGMRCDKLNSSNIVLLLSNHPDHENAQKMGHAPFDIRRPYLLHSPPSPQPSKKSFHGEGHLSTSIYQHPNDNTMAREQGPALAYDVYSFGLILLEIGLWTPLSRLWKPKYNRTTFASRIKNIYVPKLSSRCGTAYMKVVQSCVNLPDIFDSTTSTSFCERQFLFSCMIQIGRDLSRCCAIDVHGPSCEPDLAFYECLNDKRSSLDSEKESGQHDSSSGLSNSIGAAPADTSSGTNNNPDTMPAAPPQQIILKKWNNLDIPQECLDQWNNYLMPRISKLLQKALDSSRESCSASLMMVGKTPETAKTTICIQCTSVEKVRDCLRRNFRCKNGWGLVVMRGDIRRSGKSRKKNKSRDSDGSRSGPSPQAQSAYQQRPQFGASIGAFRDNEHLPPVSFGGAILVDGKPYGMTVHHMLDAPSDDEDDFPNDEDAEVVQRSAGRETDALLTALDNQFSGESTQDRPNVLEISDDESECSTIRPDYIDVDGSGGFWFAGDSDGTPGLEDDFGSDSNSEGSSDMDDDEDDRVSVGDIIGIDPADDEEVYVTQPAIDDVDDDFFPCMEDRDDDHLASHSLGYVHASSGIRRVVTGNVKHEVDWALIKIRDERLALSNMIQQHLTKSKRSRRDRTKDRTSTGATPGSQQQSQPSITHLTTVAPSSTLPRLPVSCHGRTSGLQSGRISPALALVKLHGRTSFSSSWVVEGGGFGVPGDSGAWIYDPAVGRLCGHVLAWGSQSKTAYMAPMEVLFEDIRRRLGAERVELPGASCGEEKLESSAAVASTQPRRQKLDILQDGMEKLCLPASISRSSVDVDQGVEMDDNLPPPPAPLPPPPPPKDTKKDNDSTSKQPLEVALGNLQITDKLTTTALRRDAVNAKDMATVSVSCQTQAQAQARQHLQRGGGEGLQKVSVLGEQRRVRVLGSRVA